MAKSRETYPQTIAVLKQWRAKRKICYILSLFGDYSSNKNIDLRGVPSKSGEI